MVKTPRTRHSKVSREPVTIDLGPEEVSRIKADQEKASEEKTAGVDPAEADTAASSEENAAKSEAGAFEYGFEERPAEAKPAEPEAAAPEQAQTERDWSPKAPEPPSAPRRATNGLAAGLIGGIIALAGAGALQWAGLLGAPGAGSENTSLDTVNSEIASLRNEIATLKSATDDDGAAARVRELAAQLDQAKAEIAGLKTATEQGGAGDKAGFAALGDKVQALESAVATLDSKGDAAPVDLGPVNDKLAALETATKTAGDAASRQEGQLTDLNRQVSQLAAKVEAQASQPKIALAIAASALKSALDRGAPFSAELETFAAIRPDAPEIAVLRPYAEKGVPTRAEIAGGVDAAANAMIAAATPSDPNEGFFQRLMSSAETLVKVRPIGAVEGKGVPETVARLEVAINQGDYARALAEYDSLPEAAKAAGADLAASLKARQDAEAAVDALVSGAMKG